MKYDVFIRSFLNVSVSLAQLVGILHNLCRAVFETRTPYFYTFNCV